MSLVHSEPFDFTDSLSVTVEAGHSYTLYVRPKGRQLWFTDQLGRLSSWLVDDATGAIIAGEKP